MRLLIADLFREDTTAPPRAYCDTGRANTDLTTSRRFFYCDIAAALNMYSVCANAEFQIPAYKESEAAHQKLFDAPAYRFMGYE